MLIITRHHGLRRNAPLPPAVHSPHFTEVENRLKLPPSLIWSFSSCRLGLQEEQSLRYDALINELNQSCRRLKTWQSNVIDSLLNLA